MCLDRKFGIGKSFLLVLLVVISSLQASGPSCSSRPLVEKVLAIASIGLAMRGVLVAPPQRRRGPARRNPSVHTFRGFGQFCIGLGTLTVLQLVANKRRTRINPMSSKENRFLDLPKKS